MSGHEQIERTLRWVGITHKTSPGTNRMQPVSTPCDELLRINLVTRIPDQAVVGKVKCQVKSQTEFDNTEVASEMRRAASNNSDQFTTHFRRKLIKFCFAQSPEVSG